MGWNRKQGCKQALGVLVAACMLAAASPAAAQQKPAAAQQKTAKPKIEKGIASVYSYKGRRSASGETINPKNLTAAHRTLSFGTKVRVTNRKNGRSVVVRIIDRGPFIRGRVIDISPAAARALGFSGLAPVTLSVLDSGRAS